VSIRELSQAEEILAISCELCLDEQKNLTVIITCIVSELCQLQLQNYTVRLFIGECNILM
jgi:hypothetical protein